VTPDELTVLTSSALVVVASGCELLGADLQVVEELAEEVESWAVEWALLDDIHRACRIRLTRELVWGVDRVRLWQELQDGITGVSVRWDVGVFSLITPDRQVGEEPVTYEVQGFDGLYLLGRQVGRDYTATMLLPDGITKRTYRQALLDAFAAAGIPADQVLIEGAAADSTLPRDRRWPRVAASTDPDQTDIPVTWLRVVNDLQDAWNGRGVWVDGQGRYRCQAYQEPAQRPPTFTFDVDDLDSNIVAEDRTVTEDPWKTPNRWVVICSNPPEGVTATEANGYIQVRENADDGPTSIQGRRGLEYPSVLRREAASVAKLSEITDRIVAADRRATKRAEYSTGPFPAAGHADVFDVRDAEAGITAKVQALTWTVDSAGSDTPWTWEVVS
jgi:hypothetical protein